MTEQFLGILAVFCAQPGLNPVVMCVAAVFSLSFKTWESLKSLLWLFSQGRDTHSGLLPLVLGLEKGSNKAFIWQLQSVSWILLKGFPALSC